MGGSKVARDPDMTRLHLRRHHLAIAGILAALAGACSAEAPPGAGAGTSGSRGGEGGNLLGTGGESGVGGALGPTDASTSFPCLGSAWVDGGPGDGALAAPGTCILGQGYCMIDRLTKVPDGGSIAACQSLDACAATPTCACVMPVPYVNCTCSDSGGAITIVCDQI